MYMHIYIYARMWCGWDPVGGGPSLSKELLGFNERVNVTKQSGTQCIQTGATLQ